MSLKHRLLMCESLSELKSIWENYEGNKFDCTEVKETMKVYLMNKDKEIYQSDFTEEIIKEKFESIFDLSSEEKKQLLAMNTKKLKYYGEI